MSFLRLGIHPQDELAPDTSHEQALADLKLWREAGAKDEKTIVTPGALQLKPAQAPVAFWRSVSGLSAEHVHKAVNMTLQAAVLTYHHAPVVHYTQEAGPRWEGIHRGLKSWRGEYPHYADCSSFATWCLWQGLDHFHHSDTVNGEHWRAGYTGTLLVHGKHVGTPIPGDLIIYGNGWPGEHTAVYTGGGLVVSHGSEAGPFLLPYRYRQDVLAIRRYI